MSEIISKFVFPVNSALWKNLLRSFWDYRKNKLIDKPSKTLSCLCYYHNCIESLLERKGEVLDGKGVEICVIQEDERPLSADSVRKMSNRKGDGVKEMVKLGSAGRCTCWQSTLLSSVHSASASLYKHCCGNIHPVPKLIWWCR
jgi:hypothetical protein